MLNNFKFLTRRKDILRKKKSIIIFIVGLTIVVVSIYLLSANTDSLKVFENKDLGITFEYPRSLGKPQTTMSEVSPESGKKIEIIFKKGALIIGGVTEDYTTDRDSSITDTRGFTQKRGKYYYRGPQSKSDIEILPETGKINPKIFYNIDRTREILFLDDESFEAEKKGLKNSPLVVGEGNIAAIVNLPSDTYTGLAFWNVDTELISPAEFENLVRSIELIPASEPEKN